jgi:hypothetical protein
MQRIFQPHTFPFVYSQRYKLGCSLHMTSSLITTTNTSRDKLIYITLIRILKIVKRAEFFLVMQGMGTREVSVVNAKE